MKWQLNLLYIGICKARITVYNGVRVQFLSRHCAANIIYTTNTSMLKIILLLQFCGWLYLIVEGWMSNWDWNYTYIGVRTSSTIKIFGTHEGVHAYYIYTWLMSTHRLLVWRIKHHIRTHLIRFFSTYYSSSSCNLFCKFCQNLKLNKENNIRTCLKVVKPGWILIPT